MKKQIKLTESELKQVIRESVENILKEYTDFEKIKMFGRPSNDDEDDGFNEQPVNNVVGENIAQYKVTEPQLKGIVKESVMQILKEIGDKHRFGLGKYGLAMDAASKAKALGRKQQAYNIMQHGADAFNKEFGTDDFSMDEYGTLRHRGNDGNERMYRPQSILNTYKGISGTHYDRALKNNRYIKDAASTAKAYPRKKMTGGINAVDTVDREIHGQY